MRAPIRLALLTFVGLVLLQAAWIFAVPPFRGSDEFDHAYRAAGVANGYWQPSVPAHHGRGVVVEVPAGIAAAASDQCAALEYTGVDNCYPIDERGDGTVSIATAAGQYHPLYYAVIGFLAEPFDGAHALYVMRGVSALLCSLVGSLAALALGLSRAGPWTWFGFVASLTPVFIYSTALPAPNGLEMVAGLCLWTSLLALARGHLTGSRFLAMLFFATGSACVLAVLRMLGPVWLGLIVLTVVSFTGGKRVWAVIRSHPTAFSVATLAVTGAVAHGAWWTLSSGMATEWVDEPPESLHISYGSNAVVWVLQIVGAFPLRNEPAPPGVYALYFLVVLTLLAGALTRARGHKRWTLAMLCAVVVLLPIALTYATADTQGLIWQGRYGLAFVCGVLILCGSVLDRNGFGQRFGLPRVMLPAGWIMLTAAHGWSVLDVLWGERNRAVSVSDPSWLTVPVGLVGAFAVSGMALLWLNTPRRSLQAPLDSVMLEAQPSSQSRPREKADSKS